MTISLLRDTIPVVTMALLLSITFFNFIFNTVSYFETSAVRDSVNLNSIEIRALSEKLDIGLAKQSSMYEAFIKLYGSPRRIPDNH